MMVNNFTSKTPLLMEQFLSTKGKTDSFKEKLKNFELFHGSINEVEIIFFEISSPAYGSLEQVHDEKDGYESVSIYWWEKDLNDTFYLCVVVRMPSVN